MAVCLVNKEGEIDAPPHTQHAIPRRYLRNEADLPTIEGIEEWFPLDFHRRLCDGFED